MKFCFPYAYSFIHGFICVLVFCIVSLHLWFERVSWSVWTNMNCLFMPKSQAVSMDEKVSVHDTGWGHWSWAILFGEGQIWALFCLSLSLLLNSCLGIVLNFIWTLWVYAKTMSKKTNKWYLLSLVWSLTDHDSAWV